VVAGERSRLALEFDVPPGEPGPHRFGTVRVTYDSAATSGAPATRRLPLTGTYSEDRRAAERSVNPEVNRFVLMLATMNAMLVAHRSGNRAAIEEVLGYIDRETKTLDALALERDDRETQDLARMFRHCARMLRRQLDQPGGAISRQDRELAKEIGYRLYRLRHHARRESGPE